MTHTRDSVSVMETAKLPHRTQPHRTQLRRTPLSRLVEDADRGRKTTPLDLLHLARKKFLAGERIDLGRLAAELGVARVTVFRWVGTRESLYGEVCSQLFQKEIDRAMHSARGEGLNRLLFAIAILLRSLA